MHFLLEIFLQQKQKQRRAQNQKPWWMVGNQSFLLHTVGIAKPFWAPKYKVYSSCPIHQPASIQCFCPLLSRPWPTNDQQSLYWSKHKEKSIEAKSHCGRTVSATQQFWTVMSTWISKKTFPIRSVLCSSKQVSYNLIYDKYVSNSTVPSNTPSNKICLVQVNVRKKMDHWGKNPKCFHLKVGYGWLPYFYRGGKNWSFRNHLIGKFQLTFHVYILLFGFNMQKCWGPFTSFNLALPTQRPQRTATHVHL